MPANAPGFPFNTSGAMNCFFNFPACVRQLTLWALLLCTIHAAPVVSNITAAQRAGTKLVDITYNVAAPGFAKVEVTLQASSDGGATWTVPVNSVTGAVGAGVTPGTGKTISWNRGGIT